MAVSRNDNELDGLTVLLDKKLIKRVGFSLGHTKHGRNNGVFV